MSLLPHLGPVSEHLRNLRQVLPSPFTLSTTQKVVLVSAGASALIVGALARYLRRKKHVIDPAKLKRNNFSGKRSRASGIRSPNDIGSIASSGRRSAAYSNIYGERYGRQSSNIVSASEKASVVSGSLASGSVTIAATDGGGGDNGQLTPQQLGVMAPATNKKVVARRQIKLPSVGTSDAWREYHIKKEERLKKLEEEKENGKRKREDNKILRLNKQKAARKTAKKEKNASKGDGKEQINYKKLKETDKEILEQKENGVYNIGDYVIVNFENELYPDVITDKKDDNVIVNAMAKAGGDSWKWPKPKDEIKYDYQEIVQKIKTPQENNKRGFYSRVTKI